MFNDNKPLTEQAITDWLASAKCVPSRVTPDFYLVNKGEIDKAERLLRIGLAAQVECERLTKLRDSDWRPGCAYCGWIGRWERTIEASDAREAEHARSCEKHPLFQALAEAARLRTSQNERAIAELEEARRELGTQERTTGTRSDWNDAIVAVDLHLNRRLIALRAAETPAAPPTEPNPAADLTGELFDVAMKERQERLALAKQLAEAQAERDSHRKLLEDTLSILPVGNLRTHTIDTVPDRVQAFADSLAEMREESVDAARAEHRASLERLRTGTNKALTANVEETPRRTITDGRICAYAATLREIDVELAKLQPAPAAVSTTTWDLFMHNHAVGLAPARIWLKNKADGREIHYMQCGDPVTPPTLKCSQCGGVGYITTASPAAGFIGYAQHSCSVCGGTGKHEPVTPPASQDEDWSEPTNGVTPPADAPARPSVADLRMWAAFMERPSATHGEVRRAVRLLLDDAIAARTGGAS